MGEAKRKHKAKLNAIRALPHKFVGVVTDVGPKFPGHTVFSPNKDDSEYVVLGDESSIKGKVIRREGHALTALKGKV